MKLSYLKCLFTSMFDNFWKHFNFHEVNNKYTKIKNISLTCYFSELYSLLSSQLSTKPSFVNNNYVATRVPFLSLPLNSKSINSTLFYQFTICNLFYNPYFGQYIVRQSYSYVTAFLKFYVNLNFYYLKVYEH